MTLKKGRISKEEEIFIRANSGTLSVEDLARHLNRDPLSITGFLKRKLKVGSSPLETAEYELESRPYWPELQAQFDEGELSLFKYHWVRIIGQFKDNVIPTEELQVIDLIKLELLMNRCLKLNKSGTDQILAYEAIVATERAKDPELREHEVIINLERQVASLRASQESLTRDYRELQTKKNAMLKEMRATREQRVKDIEESKQTLMGWIKYLIENPEVRKQYGLEMEKMRIAMFKERDRLSKFHKYEDGVVDQPFLTVDTVRD